MLFVCPYQCICLYVSQIPFLNQVKDFHDTGYEECPTRANPTTLLLIFYCGAGTTTAPLTTRLVVIFINSEVFGDRNLITALMCLFKVTEQKRFTIITEVFEAKNEDLRAFVYLRSIVLAIEKLAHQYLKFIYVVKEMLAVEPEQQNHVERGSGTRSRMFSPLV